MDFVVFRCPQLHAALQFEEDCCDSVQYSGLLQYMPPPERLSLHHDQSVNLANCGITVDMNLEELIVDSEFGLVHTFSLPAVLAAAVAHHTQSNSSWH